MIRYIKLNGRKKGKKRKKERKRKTETFGKKKRSIGALCNLRQKKTVKMSNSKSINQSINHSPKLQINRETKKRKKKKKNW